MEQDYNNSTKLLSVNHQIEKFRMAEKSHKKYLGLETGFAEIDDKIDGLQKLVLLGGVAGAGKTTLALQLALGVAKIEKIPVLFVSFEMTEADLVTMAIQNLSNKTLSQKDLLKPRNEMTLNQIENYDLALGKFSEISNHFYIVDRSKINPTIDQIEKTISAIKDFYHAENMLVVIDSLDDLLAYDQSNNRSQVQEELIGRLEILQQKTSATILAITQKDRNTLNGSQQEGLRGDVSLYHKPTIVMELISYKEILRALEDEGHLGLKNEKQRIEEVIEGSDTPFPSLMYISKHRNGVGGKFPLQFHGAYRTFESGRVAKFDNLNQYKIYNYLNI
jgi:replicative DNA helicase